MADAVPECQLAKQKPKAFWKHFISQRKPVVIHGTDASWSHFTDDFLTSKAGDAVVMVEHRSGNSDSYGQGRKSPMTLRDFLHQVQLGNSTLYMSTQEVGVGRDGHPLLYGPPLTELAGCFPLQQPLCGNLVPQSINMWMGCAPGGSSSGLHHDFHDNLYVLLRGSKCFRLYPPSAAPDMYVTGTIKRIYPNGRIVYDGQGDVQADGSDLHDVKLWLAHHGADSAAAAAAAAAAGSAEAADAEALLEQQLDTMLQEGCDGDDADAVMDDYIDSDMADSSSEESSGVGDGGSDLSGGAGAHTNGGHTNGRAAGTSSVQSTWGTNKQQQQQQPGVLGCVELPPPSFSQVQLGLPAAEVRRCFPRFPGPAAAAEVVLQAGDMLYLPAGWFHEVTSFGGAGLDGGHLAINYWYHPPDNLDPSESGFKQPYSSPYYPTIWANRLPWLEHDIQAWSQHHKHRLQQHQQPAANKQHNAAHQPQVQQQKQPKLRQRRHIAWAQGVSEPGNAYHASNTRPGTATGSCDKLPQHSGLIRPTSIDAAGDGSSGSSGDGSGADAGSPPPDDEQQHHKLGQEVLEGLDALEAYFGDNQEAMQQLLAEYLRSRRTRLAAAGRRGMEQQTAQLPCLPGRRHHFTVVLRTERRRPKPLPQQH